jgi:uncharacterized protein
MPRKWVVSLVLGLLLSFACNSASGTEPKDLPKPTDWVSDFAHVLSPAAIKEIDSVCSRLDQSNADTQVAVVTIPTLDGADIAKYATDLSNAWGVGSKKSSRGVLVLLAIKDHKWRIAVSRALEGTLTDSKALSIGEKMIPLLRANDFDGAVELAVNQIARVVPPK